MMMDGRSADHSSVGSPRDRRSAIHGEYDSLHDPVVQERALRLAESLMRHELARRTEKFVLFKRTNFMKFAGMVISILTYLMTLHADIQSLSYNAFTTQLGVSTALIPSIYRVSSMFLRLNLASPILDLLIVVVILVHQSVAAVVLLFVTYNAGQRLEEMLYFIAALLFVGVGVGIAEIGSAVFSTQLRRRSSSWTSYGEQQQQTEPDQPIGPML